MSNNSKDEEEEDIFEFVDEIGESDSPAKSNSSSIFSHLSSSQSTGFRKSPGKSPSTSSHKSGSSRSSMLKKSPASSWSSRQTTTGSQDGNSSSQQSTLSSIASSQSQTTMSSSQTSSLKSPASSNMSSVASKRSRHSSPSSYQSTAVTSSAAIPPAAAKKPTTTTFRMGRTKAQRLREQQQRRPRRLATHSTKPRARSKPSWIDRMMQSPTTAAADTCMLPTVHEEEAGATLSKQQKHPPPPSFDHGDDQMMVDHVLYLCSTLLEGSSNNNKTDPYPIACELVLLMSCPKRRRRLFLNKNNSAPLTALLNVLAQPPPTNEQQRCPDKQQQRARNVLGLCVYYLSLDATLSDDGCGAGLHSHSLHARTIRHAILNRPEVVQGILTTWIIWSDSLVPFLRGMLDPTTTTPLPTIHVPKQDDFSQDSGSNVSTPASSATPESSASVDPTAAGRRRRKRRRLLFDDTASTDSDPFSFTLSHPGRGESDSVASSVDSKHLATVQYRVEDVTSNILEAVIAEDATIKRLGSMLHRCGRNDSNDILLRSIVPLVAFMRLVTGKCKNSETSCLDDDDGDGDEDYNPLIATNTLLYDGGAIPLLSRALAESLLAVRCQLETDSQQQQNAGTLTNKECRACLAALQCRISLLVSIIDETSLLSGVNRMTFCEEGYTEEANGYLILGLVTTLHIITKGSRAKNSLFRGIWGEISLSLLSMLTSLTHENSTAAKELETQVKEDVPFASECGYNVIGQVLWEAVRKQRVESADHKLIYDCVIYCLNTLTNAIESGGGGGSSRILADMKVDGNEDQGTSVSFLVWLTRWLIGEASTFQDAVVESTFGSSPSKHNDRVLDKTEDEKLVLAGNGVILLCCVLVDDPDDEVRDSIFSELPGNEKERKLLFLKNTLKAFLNFYQYSVGDLSMAIVEPVKDLMQRLEKAHSQTPT